MHVLFVNKVSPRLGGGAELRLLEISRRLVEEGHKVSVISSKTEIFLPDYEQIDGIDVFYLDLLPDFLFRYKRTAFYLSRYLFYPATAFVGGLVKRIQPDVIVDYASPAPSLIWWWARRLKTPLVAEVMEYRRVRDWFRVQSPVTATFGWLAQLLFKLFAYQEFIAISDFTKQELAKAGIPSEKIAVVPCGITTDQFSLAAPIQRRRNTIIVVNRLVPLKGHKYLIDALQIVRQNIPDVQLIIVGDGPARSELEMYVKRKGLFNHVQFTGRVTDGEKAALLWQSTIFVSPSVQEGFGIVLLEAMACGLPIIAFNLPVYHEIFEPECGFLVPFCDVEAMGARITKLLRDKSLWKKTSLHNLRHVQEFGWEQMANLEEQVLESAVSTYKDSYLRKFGPTITTNE